LTRRNVFGAAGLARYPSLPYVLPFAAFILLLALQGQTPLRPEIDLPLRLLILAGLLFAFSRKVIDLESRHLASSALLGIAVFLIWIGPDALIPGYRDSKLFQNALTGQLRNSIPAAALSNPIVLWSRILRAVVLVPIIEELFWRGWLMRWLISPRFEEIKLGAYSTQAFWITAVLFATEHGPYWDVGLVTGVIYNWWMVRTRSLGDCILMHSVTNACLCGYVVATRHWEYWL
jgi:CAAX prenyl protease-like protein